MRILHFLWGLANGGAENLAVDLANEQSREHEVTLLVANAKVDEAVRSRIATGVRFIDVGRPEGSRNPIWFGRLLRALGQARPDVLHSHNVSLARFGRFIAAPMLMTAHTTGIPFPAGASRFARVCCISEAVLADVRRRYPSLNACLVNNGINMREIVPAARQPGGAAVRAVQVGRLVHETKGQDLLIESLAKLNAEPGIPKLSVDFIGDGPSLGFLMELAERSGVAGACRFLGSLPREDVYKKLGGYDLLIQPSRIEGFGLTVAEGMAAGTTVVVSDLEGPMQIIRNGELGYCFRSGDASSLISVLRQAISALNTPEEKARLAVASAHIAERYDLKQSSELYCRIYAEVASERNRMHRDRPAEGLR